MKEYLSRVENVIPSTLISSQKDFFGAVTTVLNKFGYSATCANLDDGPYVMQLVFKARDKTRRLSGE